VKPDIVDVLAIMQMKAEARALYEEIDRRVSEIAEEYGEGRFDYELPDDLRVDGSQVAFVDQLHEDGGFIKFEIVDNVAALQSGKVLYTSAAFKPLAFSARSLKRRPKSLVTK